MLIFVVFLMVFIMIVIDRNIPAVHHKILLD